MEIVCFLWIAKKAFQAQGYGRLCLGKIYSVCKYKVFPKFPKFHLHPSHCGKIPILSLPSSIQRSRSKSSVSLLQSSSACPHLASLVCSQLVVCPGPCWALWLLGWEGHTFAKKREWEQRGQAHTNQVRELLC